MSLTLQRVAEITTKMHRAMLCAYLSTFQCLSLISLRIISLIISLRTVTSVLEIHTAFFSTGPIGSSHQKRLSIPSGRGRHAQQLHIEES